MVYGHTDSCCVATIANIEVLAAYIATRLPLRLLFRQWSDRLGSAKVVQPAAGQQRLRIAGMGGHSVSDSCKWRTVLSSSSARARKRLPQVTQDKPTWRQQLEVAAQCCQSWRLLLEAWRGFLKRLRARIGH